MATEDGTTGSRKAVSLLDGPPRVINVGLERFADDLAAHGTTCLLYTSPSPRDS